MSYSMLQANSYLFFALMDIVSTPELSASGARTHKILSVRPLCPHVRSATVEQALSFGWLFRRDAWQRLRDQRKEAQESSSAALF